MDILCVYLCATVAVPEKVVSPELEVLRVVIFHVVLEEQTVLLTCEPSLQPQPLFLFVLPHLQYYPLTSSLTVGAWSCSIYGP